MIRQTGLDMEGDVPLESEFTTTKPELSAFIWMNQSGWTGQSTWIGQSR